MDESKTERSAWELCLLLKSKGLLAKPTHVNIIRLAPPLCITEEQLMEGVNIIGESLKEIVNMKKEDVPNDLGHWSLLLVHASLFIPPLPLPSLLTL